MNPSDFSPPGWHLIGQFDSGVGSWLLHHGGEAALLEIPEGLTMHRLSDVLIQLGSPHLSYVFASHEHEDHFDRNLWECFESAFPYYPGRAPWPQTYFLRSRKLTAVTAFSLGREWGFIIKAPKHSRTDLVTIWKGCAMTGDIELGTLESVNDEVPLKTKIKSFNRLASFEERNNYRVHTVFSAHLNDLRTNVDWKSLFDVPETANSR